MKDYLQSLIAVAVILTGILIVLFYSLFEKVDDSNKWSNGGQSIGGAHGSQGVGEVRRTDFSQITRILNYTYIGLVVTFLLIVYFLVPRQKLE